MNWKTGLFLTTLLALIGWATFPTGNPSQMVAGRSSASLPAQTGDPQPAMPQDVLVQTAYATLSTAVRDLPPADLSELDPRLDREINPRLSLFTPLEVEVSEGLDPLLAIQAASHAPAAPNAFGTPLLNFEAQGYSFVQPPDTVGEVGLNHYIHMINGSGGTQMRIYNKSGVQIGNTIIVQTLGSGGCATGAGDPIVLYDHLANRWMISEFSGSTNALCVYVSQTADPTGSWYAYQFNTPNFPDYPKYSVWTDGYYATTNEDSGPTVYAFERAAMLTGAPADMVRLGASPLAGFGFQALTPADLDGPAPPTNSPALFMRHRDDEVHNGGSNNPSEDYLEIWQFAVDWTTPANSTFTKLQDVATAEFSSDLCGLTSYSCIAQPSGGIPLDPLREVIMWRLQYRNFGTHQSLVGNHATDVDGTDRAGVRWFELRRTSGAWSLYQQGTYAPSDGLSRWMGAIAMDGDGNMALGYNVSSTSLHPSLRYAGRLATDTLGTLPQGEYNIVTGAGVNTAERYGDYSAMSVDPADDCTFWFTGQYNPTSQWSTRITTFKFDNCGVPIGPLDETSYMPLVMRPAATPTPTPTPSPTPPAGIPTVLNGNFESGRDGSWAESSSNGWNIITNSLPPTPRSGIWAAWLGGDDNETSQLSQAFTLPSSPALYLNFYYLIGSDDACGFDEAVIYVGATAVASFDLCLDNSNVNWVGHSVNMAPYVGQTVTVSFTAVTDSSLNSNFFVDDVAFSATPLADAEMQREPGGVYGQAKSAIGR